LYSQHTHPLPTRRSSDLGKYVTVHDSDDYSSPDRFQRQILFLEAHPEFAMCGTWFYEIDQSGSVVREIDLESDPDRLRTLIRSEDRKSTRLNSSHVKSSY